MGHHHDRYTEKECALSKRQLMQLPMSFVRLQKCIVFTFTFLIDPMEEDILQVVKYCTELIDYKDLEKLDLIVKYMKR